MSRWKLHGGADKAKQALSPQPDAPLAAAPASHLHIVAAPRVLGPTIVVQYFLPSVFESAWQCPGEEQREGAIGSGFIMRDSTTVMPISLRTILMHKCLYAPAKRVTMPHIPPVLQPKVSPVGGTYGCHIILALFSDIFHGSQEHE